MKGHKVINFFQLFITSRVNYQLTVMMITSDIQAKAMKKR